MNNSYLFRRIGAYVLDILFVILLIFAISQISFLNPNQEKYNEYNDEYVEYYKNTTSGSSVSYDEDYVKDLSYNLALYGTPYTIASIIVYLGYYVLFQYFNKGQTLGKKIMKIRLVSNDEKNLKIWQVLVRSLLIFTIVSDLASVIAVNFIPNSYYLISTIFSYLTTGIFYICVISFLFRKDSRGIHDVIAKTKVIDEKVNI